MSLLVPSWRNKVEQGMYSVVSESGVTLDTRLFSQNVVVLTFQIANNLLEPECNSVKRIWHYRHTYAGSLSMLSPNPGVSTIVKEMRTSSSSSSVVGRGELWLGSDGKDGRTDSNGMYFDPVLSV